MPNLSAIRSPTVVGNISRKIGSSFIQTYNPPDVAPTSSPIPWEITAYTGLTTSPSAGLRPCKLRVDARQSAFDLNCKFAGDFNDFMAGVPSAEILAPAGEITELDIYGLLGGSLKGEGAAYMQFEAVIPQVLFETNPTSVEGQFYLRCEFIQIPIRW